MSERIPDSGNKWARGLRTRARRVFHEGEGGVGPSSVLLGKNAKIKHRLAVPPKTLLPLLRTGVPSPESKGIILPSSLYCVSLTSLAKLSRRLSFGKCSLPSHSSGVPVRGVLGQSRCRRGRPLVRLALDPFAVNFYNWGHVPRPAPATSTASSPRHETPSTHPLPSRLLGQPE